MSRFGDFLQRVVLKAQPKPTPAKQDSLYDRPCPVCGGAITAVAKCPEGPVYCENGHKTPLPEFFKDQ